MLLHFNAFGSLVLLLPSLLLCSSARSQETAPDSTQGWQTGGNVGATFSQVGLQNWSGGGQNTITVSGMTSFFAKARWGESAWGNSFDAGYGLTKPGDAEFRKSDDKLIVVSNYGYRLADNLLWSALIDLRTQFTAGFNYDMFDSATGDYQMISRFLAPGYATLGVGVTWKPVDDLEVLVAPVSNRAIIVLDDSLSAQGAYGVDPGEKFRSQLGSLLNATIKREIAHNVELGSRLKVFAPYEEFTQMVVNWETLFIFKVNDFINASLGLDLIYDPNVVNHRDDATVGPRLQFRDVLGIGFVYKY